MSQSYNYPNSSSDLSIPAIGQNGDPVPEESILVGAQDDDSNLQPLHVDSSGNLKVAVTSVGQTGVDIQDLLGQPPSSTNALAVQLTDGSNYVNPPTADQVDLISTELNSLVSFADTLNQKVGGQLSPNGPYDEINLTYITSGNGTGQVGTVSYTYLGTSFAQLQIEYDASDRISHAFIGYA